MGRWLENANEKLRAQQQSQTQQWADKRGRVKPLFVVFGIFNVNFMRKMQSIVSLLNIFRADLAK